MNEQDLALYILSLVLLLFAVILWFILTRGEEEEFPKRKRWKR